MRESRYILGMRVDGTTYDDACNFILEKTRLNHSTYVCVSNVHMVMEAFDSAEFKRIVNNAALVTPDGMPLVWALKALGLKNVERVYGPSLTPFICRKAEETGTPVGFYGGTPSLLKKLKEKLKVEFPKLDISYMFCPPFSPLTKDEDEEIIKQIRSCGVKILFVGLGCPKQEVWMFRHCDNLEVVMVGVGAAFDFMAGAKPQAPQFIQQAGLEWLYRLTTEPTRLWKRYLYNNPRFIYYFGRQLLGLTNFDE